MTQQPPKPAPVIDICHYCLRHIVQSPTHRGWWHKYSGAVRCGTTGLYAHYFATPIGRVPRRAAAGPERIG